MKRELRWQRNNVYNYYIANEDAYEEILGLGDTFDKDAYKKIAEKYNLKVGGVQNIHYLMRQMRSNGVPVEPPEPVIEVQRPRQTKRRLGKKSVHIKFNHIKKLAEKKKNDPSTRTRMLHKAKKVAESDNRRIENGERVEENDNGIGYGGQKRQSVHRSRPARSSIRGKRSVNRRLRDGSSDSEEPLPRHHEDSDPSEPRTPSPNGRSEDLIGSDDNEQEEQEEQEVYDGEFEYPDPNQPSTSGPPRRMRYEEPEDEYQFEESSGQSSKQEIRRISESGRSREGNELRRHSSRISKRHHPMGSLDFSKHERRQPENDIADSYDYSGPQMLSEPSTSRPRKRTIRQEEGNDWLELDPRTRSAVGNSERRNRRDGIGSSGVSRRPEEIRSVPRAISTKRHHLSGSPDASKPERRQLQHDEADSHDYPESQGGRRSMLTSSRQIEEANVPNRPRSLHEIYVKHAFEIFGRSLVDWEDNDDSDIARSLRFYLGKMRRFFQLGTRTGTEENEEGMEEMRTVLEVDLSTVKKTLEKGNGNQSLVSGKNLQPEALEPEDYQQPESVVQLKEQHVVSETPVFDEMGSEETEQRLETQPDPKALVILEPEQTVEPELVVQEDAVPEEQQQNPETQETTGTEAINDTFHDSNYKDIEDALEILHNFLSQFEDEDVIEIGGLLYVDFKEMKRLLERSTISENNPRKRRYCRSQESISEIKICLTALGSYLSVLTVEDRDGMSNDLKLDLSKVRMMVYNGNGYEDEGIKEEQMDVEEPMEQRQQDGTSEDRREAADSVRILLRQVPASSSVRQVKQEPEEEPLADSNC